MTRTARVVEAGEAGVRVRNDDVPSAKAASSRRFWGVKERAYGASNPRGIEIGIGDTVEIFLPPGRTIASSALMFLLPLALFPVGSALAGRFVPGIGEGGAFLAGFGALAAGFPLGALIRRVFGGLGAVPEITRVLTPAEAESCGKKKAEGCGSCGLCS